MAYGVKPPPLAEWIVNLGEAAEYIFDHIIFQDNLVFVDFCEQMVKETNPRSGQGGDGRRARCQRPRLPHDRRHHALLQPVRRRDVPRSAAHEPDRARDDLPDGGAPRAPLHDLSRRRRHAADPDADHRLPQPAAALLRLHQEGRRDERRRVRLLLRGDARLRGGRAAADPARLLGRVQQPRPRRLRLREHGRLGQRDVRHPGRGRRRRARDDQPGRHQPRHPDPARLLLLRRLAERGDVRPDRTRSATRSTSATRGTRRRCPSRRSATWTAATTRG